MLDCIWNYKSKYFISIVFDAKKYVQYKEICKSMAKSGESGTRYFSENMIDLQNQLKRQMKNSEFIN